MSATALQPLLARSIMAAALAGRGSRGAMACAAAASAPRWRRGFASGGARDDTKEDLDSSAVASASAAADTAADTAAATSAPSTSAAEDGDASEPWEVVYIGLFNKPHKRLKLASLVNCAVSLAACPVILTYSDAAPLARVGVAAGATMFGLLTTAALHWFTSPYVHELAVRRGADAARATTINVFGRERCVWGVVFVLSSSRVARVNAARHHPAKTHTHTPTHNNNEGGRSSRSPPPPTPTRCARSRRSRRVWLRCVTLECCRNRRSPRFFYWLSLSQHPPTTHGQPPN